MPPPSNIDFNVEQSAGGTLIGAVASVATMTATLYLVTHGLAPLFDL